ncbi:MAG: hypothetical protein EOP49_48060 [Sphingobacteriales bacterium]|nr:MAG: hypothetical protein EOP49_48060 [Sphingobacteriales bacterium]
MKSTLTLLTLTVLMVFGSRFLPAQTIFLRITKRYLNLPVSHVQNWDSMQFRLSDKSERSFRIRLAYDKPDYGLGCGYDLHFNANYGIIGRVAD